MSRMSYSSKALAAIGALTVIGALSWASCRSDNAAGPDAFDSRALAAKGGTPGSGGGGKPGGGGDEGFGNNLSHPVIFANGKGLTGAALSGNADFANTGLRPLSTETAAFAVLTAGGTVPFWNAGNIAEPFTTGSVFWQKTDNTWQAQWTRGTGTTSVIADWGDNFRSVTYASTSVIRVEHVLNANNGMLLKGYPMDVTVNPSSSTERQGIYDDGYEHVTVDLTPTVYTDRARLTLQKLDAKGGNVTYTYLDKAVWESFGIDGPGNYSAEINVGGKVLFGYVWNMKNVVMPGGISKDGWWRITFSLDAGSGVSIDGIGAGDETLAKFTPSSTTAEIQIGTTRGGGKKP